METKDSDQSTSIKAAVLRKIECGDVCPRSRWFFRCREGVVWFLWGLSIMVGALAVGISLFVVSYQQYALYEATHVNLMTFMVAVLPYLWFVIFAAMVTIGVLNLRHTKRGYRYPLWQIVLSSVILSFVGGSLLHFLGLGYVIDHELGEQMNMYTSQEKMEQRMWQKPEDGRLVGQQTHSTLSPTSTIIFRDASGGVWRVEVVDLVAAEIALLQEGRPVKLIGLVTNQEAKVFHSCGAFSWVYTKHSSREELKAAREDFLDRMLGHKERAKQMVSDDLVDTGVRPVTSPCLGMALIQP